MKNFSFLFVVLTLALSCTADRPTESHPESVANSVTSVKKSVRAQRVELKQLLSACTVDHSTAESCLVALRAATASVSLSAPKPEGCVTVTFNYDIELTTMYEGYDGISTLMEDFQAKPRGEGEVTKELCWFQLRAQTHPENAQAIIEAGGDFLLADIWELNAFKMAKPSSQWRMLALGSQWDNLYPGLCGNDGEHRLCLFWSNGPDFRFLAVRK